VGLDTVWQEGATAGLDDQATIRFCLRVSTLGIKLSDPSSSTRFEKAFALGTLGECREGEGREGSDPCKMPGVLSRTSSASLEERVRLCRTNAFSSHAHVLEDA